MIGVSDYTADFAHGLMFHRLHKSGHAVQGQGSITEIQFEKLLRYAGLDRFLKPEEWISRLQEGKLKASDLCLTFDDGLKSQVDVALPVMEKLGLKAFFFIFSSVLEGQIDRNEVYNRFATTKFPSFDAFVSAFFEFHPFSEKELLDRGFGAFSDHLRKTFPFYSENDIKFRFVRNRLFARPEFEKLMDALVVAQGLNVSGLAQGLWMSDEDLRFLVRSGHTVGMHSYNHPFCLADLSLEEQKEQYRRNSDHLSQVTGRRVHSMSHPLNSYNQGTLGILEELGVVCAFRSNMKAPAHGKMNGHPLELAREDPMNMLRDLKS